VFWCITWSKVQIAVKAHGALFDFVLKAVGQSGYASLFPVSAAEEAARKEASSLFLASAAYEGSGISTHPKSWKGIYCLDILPGRIHREGQMKAQSHHSIPQTAVVTKIPGVAAGYQMWVGRMILKSIQYNECENQTSIG
jgi:hypothetical protein